MLESPELSTGEQGVCLYKVYKAMRFSDLNLSMCHGSARSLKNVIEICSSVCYLIGAFMP